jgi:thymidylate synthase
MHTVEDIRFDLSLELSHNNIKTSGHQLRNGKQYVELCNVCFLADEAYIIDAPEYEDLMSGEWYEKNYIPRIDHQISKVVDILGADPDSRHGIITFYNRDDIDDKNMICTMYVSVRLHPFENSHAMNYTVHMRSSDVREYRSDLKFHCFVYKKLMNMLKERHKLSIIEGDIIWYANSLQCWDKDFNKLL